MIDSPLIVLPEDPTEARKTFNTLSAEDQLDTVLRVRGKERLHRLFLSEHPDQLVPLLPEMEIFLTIKEVGEKDSLDLISLTTPEQFQYLLDLDFWKKDRLDPEKVLHWIEILIESDEPKVIQFIQSADPEFIALLLKKFLHVTTLEGEQLEMMDRIALFTLDQFYFIDFKGKKTREVFEPFLRTLYRVDGKGYRRLMDSLICEIESELEETAYRFRNGRLIDYGFPDFEEALEIYRFVNPDSLRGEARPPHIRGIRESQQGSSTFYLTFQRESPFLSSIFSKLGDSDEEDRLKQEITALCNKAIVAEAIDLSNISAIERVVKRAYHTLNLGLQYLSAGGEIKAVETLRSLPISRIFQCGVSLTLLLRRKAESILKGPWFSDDPENLVFLDPSYLERFEGVLRKRPTFYQEGIFEDFKDLQDLKEMEIFLESIETLVDFLETQLKVHPRSLKMLDLSGCHPGDWRGITLSTLFLTAFTHQVLMERFQFEAIEKIYLRDLFLQVFERDEKGKGVVRMEVKKDLREWLESIEGDENRRQHLLAFSDFCLDLFEEQYGTLSQGEEVDPRFIKGLLIRS